jgi:S-DNA-T family DNA segregation ATPase FtsK/SpoIIIE
MLFLKPESGHPQRLQGCFVSDREVEALVSWWKKEIDLEKAKAAAEQPEAEEEAEVEEEYVANKKPELETPWDIEIAELQAERAMAGAGKAGRSGGAEGGGEESADDELVKRAIDIIQTTGNASTSLLQRKLRIGYPRAARLMEELQEMGYVGAASKQAGKGREVKGKDDLE